MDIKNCIAMVTMNETALQMQEMVDSGEENVTAIGNMDNVPSKDNIRKSVREKKTPLHLVNTVTDINAVGETLQKRISKANTVHTIPDSPIMSRVINTKQRPPPKLNVYPNFECDHCGSRYVVNPMRRGNKISSPRYKPTPRHKIDPETQKLLTLCNACGLKFGRQRKTKHNKEELSEEEQRRFYSEGESFAKELSLKLNNEAATHMFCSNAKKNICGCIQKYICGSQESSVEEMLSRAKELVEIYLKATELKKKKCYDVINLDSKPGKKKAYKIGLGNGHRKSKEFEDFVLSKRKFLRQSLKFCEKGTQKILSYSNNFLHKRMKTDPDKGIRIERQKGKAALGMLPPIEDLTLEPCCIDNCVRMALTHGRLLETWRERATSSQVEARRVLAEMLTPSGGNRANCYRFVSWVTGCSHSTIGKVNEQMKNTGGDREPPEHGLKKYWKQNPKSRNNKKQLSPITYVPSYEILQTAANSAGLSNVLDELPTKATEPAVKKIKRQPNKPTKIGTKKSKVILTSNENRLSNTVNIVGENGTHVTTNLPNLQATVIALNGTYQNGGYISIPAGLTNGNTITIPNAVSLQTMQQQQQNIQLQIEMLQQQLQQSSQASSLPSLTTVDENPEYVVTVSNGIEQNDIVPSVVESVTSQNLNVVTQPYVANVVTQPLMSNIANSESVLPTITGNISFVSSGDTMGILQQPNTDVIRNQPNISLLTSSVADELNIINQNNGAINVITPQNTLAETSVIGMRPIESLRQVHLITSQSPTMAGLSQPVTLSLETPSISLSTLPTMLLTQSASNEQRQATPTQQFIIQHTSSTPEQLIFQRPLLSQPNTEHLVVQQTTPIMHCSTEQTVAITSSVLPPMTSFNADAFLTSNGIMTYAVLNTGAQIPHRSVIEEQPRSLEQTSAMQMPFLST